MKNLIAGMVSTLDPGEYLVSLSGKVAFETSAVNFVPWRFKGNVLVGTGLLVVGIVAQKGGFNFGFLAWLFGPHLLPGINVALHVDLLTAIENNALLGR